MSSDGHPCVIKLIKKYVFLRGVATYVGFPVSKIQITSMPVINRKDLYCRTLNRTFKSDLTGVLPISDELSNEAGDERGLF